MSFLQIPIGTFPNTFLGYQSSVSMTTGGQNTAFGFQTLNANTTGDQNTAFGHLALSQNTTGRTSVAMGFNALFNQTTGFENVAIGHASGGGITTGQGNITIGTSARAGTLNSSGNISIGRGSGGTSVVNECTFIGEISGSNNQGNNNTFIGSYSGSQITSGAKNTILGSFRGNQFGLDIRTLSNYIVLSDGDGNPRLWINNVGLVTAPGGFAGIGGGVTLNNQTANYTVVAGDAGKAINCTANNFTVSLTASATLGSGFACFVWNTGNGTITIDPNGAETIDGVSTLTLRQGEGTQIVSDGTNWLTGSGKEIRGFAENFAAGSTRPIASGVSATAIGNSSQATGSDAVAIGPAAIASTSQTIAIGTSSSASGIASSAVGYLAQATGSNSQAFGASSSATNTFALALGASASASASNSTAVGASCTASSPSSFAAGRNSVAAIFGKYAYANGLFVTAGDNQFGLTVLKASTTGATGVVMTTDGAGAASTNQLIVPSWSAFAFSGNVVARRQGAGGTESAAWRVEGLVRRELLASTAVLVASTVTVISNAPGWALALAADTTNGGVSFTATGAAGLNVRWVATIDSAEITYA